MALKNKNSNEKEKRFKKEKENENKKKKNKIIIKESNQRDHLIVGLLIKTV